MAQRQKWGGLTIAACDVPVAGLRPRIHAVVDAEGRPIAVELTAGQAHDSKKALPMLSVMRERTIILGNKAYDTNALRAEAAEKKAWTNIPAKSNRKKSFSFSEGVYRHRKPVERFFIKLKQ